MNRPVAAAALALLAAGCLAGCGSDSANPTAAITEPPLCPVEDRAGAGNGVILMAQSVPTSSWVPCLDVLPSGWTFQHLDARDGLSRFWLDSDRDGPRAIEVRLEESCDTSGAVEIASDHEYTHRLERVRRVSPAYAGERYYVFRGGCLTIVFQLDKGSPGEALAVASQAVGVVSREDLQAQVHADSGGRVDLDPSGGDGQP
ncbi:hypothetical protein [Modestobacter excelsi]|uniref:hypothetical protein n=1 Tax=Modestobacter excelsi TaxID=2213161 RepID=UPI00110D212F|nr:hypothetical protein [Modestobacter excelsi]